MAVFAQLVSTTWDDVVNEGNKSADQWSDSTFLKFLEKKGGVKRTDGGATLQLTLDYRANPGADIMLTDTTLTSTDKTSVITYATYDYKGIVVPANWSFFDEAVNSGRAAKV